MAHETTYAVKKKFFRGIEIDDLKNQNIVEFSKLVNSRERRNLQRNSKVVEEFVKKAEKKILKNKIPRTHIREMVIIPKFIDWTIGVHNGKDFTQVKITSEMLGHRLGEFAPTRKIVKHGTAGVGATKGTSSMSVK